MEILCIYLHFSFTLNYIGMLDDDLFSSMIFQFSIKLIGVTNVIFPGEKLTLFEGALKGPYFF